MGSVCILTRAFFSCRKHIFRWLQLGISTCNGWYPTSMFLFAMVCPCSSRSCEIMKRWGGNLIRNGDGMMTWKGCMLLLAQSRWDYLGELAINYLIQRPPGYRLSELVMQYEPDYQFLIFSTTMTSVTLWNCGRGRWWKSMNGIQGQHQMNLFNIITRRNL